MIMGLKLFGLGGGREGRVLYDDERTAARTQAILPARDSAISRAVSWRGLGCDPVSCAA